MTRFVLRRVAAIVALVVVVAVPVAGQSSGATRPKAIDPTVLR
jgi:hypothetical protein